MSAYVVVELTVKDPQAMERYVKAAGPIIKLFGGEFLARGPWEVLSGDAYLTTGGLVEFPDRERALAWYNSAEYQAILADRDQAMTARFKLLA